MNRPQLTDAYIDEQIRAMKARPPSLEPTAKKAWYDARKDRICVELTNGVGFSFPPRLGFGLKSATPAQLAKIEVTPGADGIMWEDLDVHIDIIGMGQYLFSERSWMRELGRAGGRAKTAAKASAARKNGALGGRPKGSGRKLAGKR
jgi:hypothetical protein